MGRLKPNLGTPPPVDLDKPFCIIHHLPNPPSVNKLFKDAERQKKDEKTGRPLFQEDGKPVMQRFRAKSEAYRKWLHYCSTLTWARTGAVQRMPVAGCQRWLWKIEVHININRRADADNYLKAIVDMLKKACITPDDRYCDDFRIIRNQEDLPEKVFTVQVWRIG